MRRSWHERLRGGSRVTIDRPPKPFLTAEWRHLAMAHFAVDPRVVAPFVPHGTELDDWNGTTFVSLVGFLFLNTRVLGVAIPFHRDFEEVNLRFYVRRRTSDGWRRAVSFVREIVPRRAIAITARILYGERYAALPMGHRIDGCAGEQAPQAVSYSWRLKGRENRLDMHAEGEFFECAPGSDAEFLMEHSWGYSRRRGGATIEYRVEHPRWRVRRASSVELDCDIAALYGSGFVECLSARPASAFLAEGSKVTVFRGRALRN